MWEVLRHLSHGRVSVRNFALVFAAVFMAFFVATLPAHQAYAEDAQRNGDHVTYEGRTYDLLKDAQGNQTISLPSGLPANTTGYFYRDDPNSKVYFLLTTTDPAQATSAQYVIYDFTPPDQYSNSSPPQTVTIAAAPANSSGNSGGETTCDGATLGGIGWIVCPTVKFIAKSMDFIYSVISSFLEVTTVTADTKGPVYKLWSVVRDIANICFVIAFLLIVYSQITSLGISNYGIKKMLPKFIIAAVLMNVSYWICGIAVDASNLLGHSIHSLFSSLFNSLSAGGNFTGSIPTWEQVAAVTLAGAGTVVGGIAIAGAGGIGSSVILLIPILVGVILSALVALLVLAARQALLMCLIIISPLAFVAYVLPNTEKYFDKWRSTTMTLLLLFPIFSVIFSGAQLAGMAIVQTSGGNIITIILGMGVQVAPIVVTPLLIKFSSGIIGKVAGMVNNPNKGLIDRTRNWAKGAAQERKNKILSDQNKFKKFNNSWANPVGKGVRTVDSYKRRRDARRKAFESMAESRYDATETGQRTRALSENADTLKTQVGNRYTRSEIGRQAIQRRQLADVDKGRADTEFEASHYGHRVDTEKRLAEMDKKLVHNSHEADWNRRVRTDGAILNQELEVKASEIQAGLEKAKLDKVHAEVVAQGHGTEHILNLHGVDLQAQAGMLNIAHDIKRGQIETTLTGMAKQAADHKLSSSTNEVMLKNSITVDGTDARKYAAGIGNEAAVLASAVAKDRKEFGEEVSYQKELASHFKLTAEQISKLAMANPNDKTIYVEGRDDSGNVHRFYTSDEHVHDMVVEQAFKVGSHNDKMKLLKSTGTGQMNYEYRSTIQQAAIQSGISSIAPAINDKTLDAIIRGEFKGDESWQYHSFRQVLEGRIKANSLSTANADSLKLLFANASDSSLTQTQFNKLINDNIAGELAILQATNPAATDADARASLINKFNTERAKMQTMAEQVLRNTTIRQNASSTSIDELKKFLGTTYTGP